MQKSFAVPVLGTGKGRQETISFPIFRILHQCLERSRHCRKSSSPLLISSSVIGCLDSGSVAGSRVSNLITASGSVISSLRSNVLVAISHSPHYTAASRAAVKQFLSQASVWGRPSSFKMVSSRHPSGPSADSLPGGLIQGDGLQNARRDVPSCGGRSDRFSPPGPVPAPGTASYLPEKPGQVQDQHL